MLYVRLREFKIKCTVEQLVNMSNDSVVTFVITGEFQMFLFVCFHSAVIAPLHTVWLELHHV